MRLPVAAAIAALSLPIAGTASARDKESKPQLTVSPATPGVSGLIPTDPPVLRYATLHADAAGATHVQSCTLKGFELKSYAPPAAPQWLGIPPGEIESISYGVLPVGYVGTWHHSPGPQWVFVLSGRWSVETTDGSVLEQGPGEFQFNAEDGATPQGPDRHIGHLTRQVGDVPNVQLIVSLKKGSTARPPFTCAPTAR
jgi:hypothetical protein